MDDDEEEFCRGDSDEERSCDSEEVCTSTCQCWDGTGMRDADSTQFTGVGILDQGKEQAVAVKL